MMRTKVDWQLFNVGALEMTLGYASSHFDGFALAASRPAFEQRKSGCRLGKREVHLVGVYVTSSGAGCATCANRYRARGREVPCAAPRRVRRTGYS